MMLVGNKGNKVEGYKLVARRSNRKWVDEEVVKKKFGKTAVRPRRTRTT